MADITMCRGEHCPRAAKCYRHTATPSERQSWFTVAPGEFHTPWEFSCEEFLPNRIDVRLADSANEERT